MKESHQISSSACGVARCWQPVIGCRLKLRSFKSIQIPQLSDSGRSKWTGFRFDIEMFKSCQIYTLYLAFQVWASFAPYLTACRFCWQSPASGISHRSCHACFPSITSFTVSATKLRNGIVTSSACLRASRSFLKPHLKIWVLGTKVIEIHPVGHTLIKPYYAEHTHYLLGRRGVPM